MLLANLRDMATLQPGQITDLDAVRPYVLGGKATVTLVSKLTGARFTYKISGQAPYPTQDERQPPTEAVWYVDVLTGADNDTAYAPLGVITQRGSTLRYYHARSSRLSKEASSAVAFQWFIEQVVIKAQLQAFAGVEVWHEGRCARCSRKLTVPSSISIGLGPECAQRVGA